MEPEPKGAPEGAVERSWAPLSYRVYFLGLLVVSYMINFTDRQLLSILLEPIKRDLALADWQLGVLGGVAFALFYVTLGVPVAKLSDRFSRVNILAGAMALWSLATAACGLAGNFIQLLLIRIGVAVGESAGTPPSYSMIADLFDPRRRATAIGIYVAGPPLGTALGLAIGGWLSQGIGWRTTFVVVGLPGLLLALLMKLTLREPPRGHTEARSDPTVAPSALAVARLLGSRPSFLCLAIGSGVAAFAGYAMNLWLPSFLIRSHGLTTAQAGGWLAMIQIGAGIGGGVLGGFVADRFAVRDKRWLALVPAVAMAVAAPAGYVAFTARSPALALAGTAVTLLGYYSWAGGVYTAVQAMVGLRMRAVAVAMLLFIINLIGLGLGPLLIGLCSDFVSVTLGLGSAEGVRWALVASASIGLVASLLFWLARKTIREEMES